MHTNLALPIVTLCFYMKERNTVEGVIKGTPEDWPCRMLAGHMSILVTTTNTGTFRAKARPRCSLVIPTIPALLPTWRGQEREHVCLCFNQRNRNKSLFYIVDTLLIPHLGRLYNLEGFSPKCKSFTAHVDIQIQIKTIHVDRCLVFFKYMAPIYNIYRLTANFLLPTHTQLTLLLPEPPFWPWACRSQAGVQSSQTRSSWGISRGRPGLWR